MIRLIGVSVCTLTPALSSHFVREDDQSCCAISHEDNPGSVSVRRMEDRLAIYGKQVIIDLERREKWVRVIIFTSYRVFAENHKVIKAVLQEYGKTLYIQHQCK